MDDTLLSAISKSNLFKNISDVNYGLLAETSESLSINEGKILFRKGDKLEYVFFIQNGEVNHFVEKKSGQTVVVVYQNNDFIIAPEYLTDDLYKSTAIAVRDTFLVKILKSDFQQFQSKDDRISSIISKTLVNLTGRQFEQPSVFVHEEEKQVAKKEENNELDIISPLEYRKGKVEKSSSDSFASRANEFLKELEPNENFSVKVNNGIFEVTVNIPEATFTTAAELKKILLQVIENNPNVIVDLCKAKMIDSTFLGALLISLKKSSAENGNLVLVGSNKSAWMIFEMTGLADVFKSFDTLEEARDYFRQQ